ncbi:MAG: MMPL family transporter [Bdellovibrionales bacterium]|nr:MMPL family transporter [Bdellovibrionales bacterium]
MKKKYFLKSIVLALGFSVVVFSYFFNKYYPIVPEVNKDFFFSDTDPQLKADQQICKEFGDVELTIIAVQGNLRSEIYQQKLKKISTAIAKLHGVVSVYSLPLAVDDPEEAMESPLFKRMLLSPDLKSSNIIISTKNANPNKFIEALQNLLSKFKGEDFNPHISGIPFIIENVRIELTEDIKVFTLVSIVFFGIAIFIIFRSLTISLGSLVTCLYACLATLFTIKLIDIQVGVLTANIVTVVFILTLSHVIFLTHQKQKNTSKKVNAFDKTRLAIIQTLPASFWSASTTIVGFVLMGTSEAKPLREFGITGVIGTLFGLFCAYFIFPWFLIVTKLKPYSERTVAISNFLARINKAIIPVLLLFLIIPFSFFATWLDTDPPLLKYFDSDSKIFKGLEYVDKTGGSSPLNFVIRRSDNQELTDSNTYDRLWALHQDIESDENVGSVLSLPLIMAEANRPLIAKILPWDWIVDLIEYVVEDTNQSPFITKDRKKALYFLRMKELGREKPRSEVLKGIEAKIKKHGFSVDLVGGMYSLQMKMGELLSDSLLKGLLKIIPVFFILGVISTKSFRLGLALGLTVTVIPIIVLGALGLFGVALDLASAPAASLAMAIGVDEMFHFLQHAKKLKNFPRLTKEEWNAVSNELCIPISGSAFIVSAGFCLFLLSNFPPTRRFGSLVLFGTILAAYQALVSLPFLCKLFSSKK